jgi:hypothetical protein
MPFPDRDTPWEGYLVVQAKFRQRETVGGNDATWALAELKKDLAKFSDTKRGLRRPDYYLFATNVILTPLAKKGGKDKITALLTECCRKHGLKGFRIWDYDQIGTLLDSQQSIRTAYTAWITPGDVLAAVLEQMQPTRPDFRAVMRTFIHNELRADQYVNLGQAGHREADRTPLARVFVDLPVGEDPWRNGARPSGSGDGERWVEEKTQETTPSGAMTELLALAAQRLDPASNPRTDQINHFESDKTPVAGRVVLIGGPGQGKSTLSQFLCQAHRAALLALDHSHPPEVKDACDLIRAQCNAESLALPTVPRFPLRVVLNHFAKALAEETVPSLFAYLRARIAGCAEREIKTDDLIAWLGAYPWLLVLDGLDEVPASSNRSQVLDSIQDFLSIAHDANADLLLVATSRPQGYNDDFAARYYRHRQLLPLDVSRALHYAERLANERWGSDPNRVERVLTRLRRAGAEEATARLMHSPLQVAIMTLLVDSAGEPPRERWRLFSEYYRVIYDRERQRDIPAARLLSDYQADIDTIHQRVALRLQIDSERAGGTDASLNAADFADLVNERLAEEDHPDSERVELTRTITEAALHRLVFLVAPSEGAVGFEVRSLQEFMAAQCLTNGPDTAVASRLRAIAPAAHWRNVFLFAAGRCFHERQHLRDTLYTLCCELNEGEGVPDGGDLERATLAGSRLALEVLEDGAVARQPAKLKLFARLALRLMDLPPCEEQLRLAAQYQVGLEDAYREEISNRLADTIAERRQGAWRVLLYLVGREHDWARSLADSHWPQNAGEALIVFQAAEDLKGGEWLAERWCGTVPGLPPESVMRLLHRATEPDWLKAAPDWALFFSHIDSPYRKECLELRLEGIHEGFRLMLVRVRGPECVIPSIPLDAHKEWRCLAEVIELSAAPSKERLANLLHQLANNWPEREPMSIRLAYGYISWPAFACIAAIDAGTDPVVLITAAREGRLGDSTDWERAERRWETNGVTAADLSYQAAEGLPFDSAIADIGFPVRLFGMSIEDSTQADALKNLLFLRSNATTAHAQTLAGNVRFLLGMLGGSKVIIPDLDPAELRGVFADLSRAWIDLNCLTVFPDVCWVEGDGVELLNLIGDASGFYSMLGGRSDLPGTRLEALTAHHPTKGGILRLLAAVCCYGYRPNRTDLHPNPDAYSDPRHQSAALLVQLALRRWDETDAVRLAPRLVNLLEQDAEIVSSALAILKQQEGADRLKECLLTALYATLPPTAWETRRRVMTAMQAQQRRRLSTPIS